jgi:hypothetical protein
MYFSVVKIQRIIASAFIVSVLALVMGCGDSKIPFFKNKKEGYIRYEVSFPNETGLMAQFYPKEMILY